MQIELKIQRIGDSLGVILPPEILKHLKASEGDTLLVSETNEADLLLNQKDQKLAVFRDISVRYQNALRSLSD
jgi:putative addiction module antidote